MLLPLTSQCQRLFLVSLPRVAAILKSVSSVHLLQRRSKDLSTIVSQSRGLSVLLLALLSEASFNAQG